MRLSKDIYEAMLDHAKKGYPNEACGILAGRQSDEATAFYPMRNLDESPISYFMDPKEQLRIFKQLRLDGIQMNGIVHSHVASEAYPSQKDVRLAFYPETSYLIVSLTDAKKPVVRSFKIRDEVVVEEKVEIV